MKKAYFILILLTWLTSVRTKAESLSENASISILTCGPGEELYSVFGHSAIRVHDSIVGLDIVFNYGTFDFNTPNFYLKFANGQLDYLLTVSRYKSFLQVYEWEERSIIEQVLNLTQSEKQHLFDSLIENAKPENRAYRYSFFFDNCATRIRDRVFDCFEPSSVIVNETGAGLTFRQLYGTYLDYSPWVKFGIHLLLGKDADKQANGRQEMYVPDYLYSQFKNTSIAQFSGTPKPLVASEKILLEYPRPIAEKPWYLWPSTVLGILLVLSIAFSVFDIIRKKPSVWLDTLLFVPTFFAGLLFTFLWFFTQHGVTENNYNLLWSNPLILLFIIAAWRHTHAKSVLLQCTSGILLLANIIWFVSFVFQLQVFPDGLFLFVLALSVRTLVWLLLSGNHSWLNSMMGKKFL